MILKASQRTGSRQLGAHLLKTEENEHVEIHEVSGFVSDTVQGAMIEAHVQNGFWVFAAPLGYEYDRAPGGGKMLVRCEPMAGIVKEALEGFASGRFASQAEVVRFLSSHAEFPISRAGTVTIERVSVMLNQVLYAGYLTLPRWDVSLRKGQHEGLIDLRTFEAIQRIIHGGARVSTRADVNADFPLRGFVVCDDCGMP
jgi:site-specific DNA recombinase